MRIFYGWVIVGVAFVAWAISTGPRSAFSIFLLAFLEDFGWSRGAAAAAFSVHMTCYALGGWAIGALVDRLGARRVMAWGTGGWAVTLLLCSRIQRLWQLYVIFGFLGGLVTGALAYVPNNAILSRWFVRYRGLAAGLSQSGVWLGTAVFGPLAQFAIASLGWRRTFLAFGALVAAAALPLILVFLRDSPQQMGLYPDGVRPPIGDGRAAGATPAPSPAFTGPGLPPGYWTVFSANILRGMTLNALLVHQVAYLVDAGYGKMAAASYMALSSLLAVFAGFAAGGISDRLGRPQTYAGVTGFYAAAIACLLLLRGPFQVVLLYVFVLTYGIFMGGAGPVFAALLTDRLHGPRFGFLLGLQNIAYGAGASLGPFLAGMLFDQFGSYTAAFLLMAGASLTSSAIVMTAVPRPAR